jgi:hypothetical protein
LVELQILNEDIWEKHKQGKYIIIPTNGDWNRFGEAVMGRGLALQAKTNFPLLPKMLGNLLKKHGNIGFEFPMWNLFTFPVKIHWSEQANLELIEQSTKDLEEFELCIKSKINFPLPIYLPKVGCGNGKLDWADVKPILEKYLNPEKFIICDKKYWI